MVQKKTGGSVPREKTEVVEDSKGRRCNKLRNRGQFRVTSKERQESRMGKVTAGLTGWEAEPLLGG